MIKPILGFLGLGLLVLSVGIFAGEIGRGDWTHQQDSGNAAVIATYGYQKMKVLDAGSGKASVIFTNVNDREYCAGQDALFNPINANINIELEIDSQLTTIALPALIGCDDGESFAQIKDTESMQLIAMMYDAKRVLFHQQSYSLNGFERAVKKVID
ncbi:hypothetical protein FM037_08520 [Shewanella psychropiezotolerans]|uniref:Uncharacterized protein n=1 Tax=Shewanella psychropiezotolerans TaxID=2593655 RepID=A0ABX5WWU8_9GAMM|nr:MULTISPECIES: hypothetical protein [Shewanella]MPY22414.1 hypothetical protein [Shewanella sp. YLB-07]QDO83266.1 hypothetical protein FM037_08520 [Shewanella psychropiezotolerans]